MDRLLNCIGALRVEMSRALLNFAKRVGIAGNAAFDALVAEIADNLRFHHVLSRKAKLRTFGYAAVGLAAKCVRLNMRRWRGTGSTNRNPCPNLMPSERTRLR
jgi:hypothetical protein